MLRNPTLSALAILVFSLLNQACHTVHGVGEDIEHAGDEIQEESEEHH